MYNRKQLFAEHNGISFFFWGTRQSGKSTWLKANFPKALYIDLLLSDIYKRFLNNPEQFRQTVLLQQEGTVIIVDEIQKLPILLDEIHWLIENANFQIILSGSSPRKLLREGVNFLGGRALRYELFPLSYSEIPDFDLNKALNQGLMPRHYLSKNYKQLIEAYIGSYLEDEIIAETKIRNVAVYAQFLNKAAFSNGEMVNYTNIAADCGISSMTVKEYFRILEQTLLGSFIQPFQKKPKRRSVSTPKFYFFDVGIVNILLKRYNIEQESINFGAAFEHFIYHEIRTYSSYSGKKFPIHFWRTSSQFEVDFILGEHQVAIEVKGTDNVQSQHLKGLKAFMEEYEVPKSIIVSNDKYERLLPNGIIVMPWKIFLDKLWNGKII